MRVRGRVHEGVGVARSEGGHTCPHSLAPHHKCAHPRSTVPDVLAAHHPLRSRLAALAETGLPIDEVLLAASLGLESRTVARRVHAVSVRDALGQLRVPNGQVAISSLGYLAATGPSEKRTDPWALPTRLIRSNSSLVAAPAGRELLVLEARSESLCALANLSGDERLAAHCEETRPLLHSVMTALAYTGDPVIQRVVGAHSLANLVLILTFDCLTREGQITPEEATARLGAADADEVAVVVQVAEVLAAELSVARAWLRVAGTSQITARWKLCEVAGARVWAEALGCAIEAVEAVDASAQLVGVDARTGVVEIDDALRLEGWTEAWEATQRVVEATFPATPSMVQARWQGRLG